MAEAEFTLRELLELMTEAASIQGCYVCFGLHVAPNGSGKTTGGGDPNMDCVKTPWKQGELRWVCPARGAQDIETGMRAKLASARESRDE